MANGGFIFDQRSVELIRRVVKQVLGEPGNVVGERQPYRRQVPAGVLFGVLITQTGGADGNKTTAASWTYTVKYTNGVQIATGISVSKTRPYGTMTAGTSGVAYYLNDALVLWDTNEVPGSGGC